MAQGWTWREKSKKLSEIQPNWCVSYSHEWHVQRHNCFGTRPPWGGAKRSFIIKFQLQRQLERFLNQTLCDFSQMKDLNHIRQRDRVNLQGWNLGGGGGGQKFEFSEHGRVAFRIKGGDR